METQPGHIELERNYINLNEADDKLNSLCRVIIDAGIRVRICDCVIYVKNGFLVFDGNPEEVNARRLKLTYAEPDVPVETKT